MSLIRSTIQKRTRGRRVVVPSGVQVTKRKAPSPKPRDDDTPYRSEVFVTAGHSADGNAYKRGEPIPEAEAMRQGQKVGGTSRAVRIPKPVCPRCDGTGKRSNKMKNHRPDCGCPGCSPCVGCGGTGRVSAG